MTASTSRGELSRGAAAVSIQTAAQHRDCSAEGAASHRLLPGCFRGSYVVLLDLSVAFHTIAFSILLDTMQTYLGISGTALCWFRSCVCERTQRVMIRSDSSADFPLRFGAPEGSVLGPVLFTVSTAPLQILMEKHCVQYHKSADDLQGYVTDSPNLPDARERTVKQLTDFIDNIVAWMISGKLKLNGIKTEFLVLLSPQQLKKYCRSENIAVDGAVIRPVMLVRNLGAHFNIHLSMVSQVSAICRKCNFHLRRIASTRAYISRD